MRRRSIRAPARPSCARVRPPRDGCVVFSLCLQAAWWASSARASRRGRRRRGGSQGEQQQQHHATLSARVDDSAPTAAARSARIHTGPCRANDPSTRADRAAHRRGYQWERQQPRRARDVALARASRRARRAGGCGSHARARLAVPGARPGASSHVLSSSSVAAGTPLCGDAPTVGCHPSQPPHAWRRDHADVTSAGGRQDHPSPPGHRRGPGHPVPGAHPRRRHRTGAPPAGKAECRAKSQHQQHRVTRARHLSSSSQGWTLLSVFVTTILGLVLAPLPVGAWAFIAITVTLATKTLTFAQVSAARALHTPLPLDCSVPGAARAQQW